MEEKRIRILNIEDEEIDHLAIMRMVRGQGLPYDVDRAANLAEAAGLLEANIYDVVLIDYRLPDGTGLDILDKLKGIASVFVTGSGSEMVAVKAMKDGADDYIVKDQSGGYLEMLPIVINKAMETVRLRKEKEEADEKLRDNLDIEKRFNKLLVQSNLQMHQVKEENKQLKKRIEELERRV